MEKQWTEETLTYSADELNLLGFVHTEDEWNYFKDKLEEHVEVLIEQILSKELT